MNIHNVTRHWMSCISVALGLLSLFPPNLFAQNYDPYVAQTDMQPNPLLPLEFGGTGVFSFEVGNIGDYELPFPQAAQANLMKLTISLAFGLPNVADPTDAAQGKAALTGPLTDYFNFEYNPLNKTYTGIQKATIPGRSRFFGYIAYRVTENRFKSDPKPQCGAAVDISAPGYTNPQSEGNDFLASYAYVEAKDYGDAPISYGAAYHYIDTSKDTSASPGPYYNNFFWLGSHIDAETNYFASSDAMGDDNTATNGLFGVNQDDEDGVTFPVMIPGTTVNIPVSYTFADKSKPTLTQRDWAYLSAWIDWNGDGVFDDSDGSPEVVSHTWGYSEDDEADAWLYKQRRRSTGSASLSVTVPEDAVVDSPIFARFRLSTTEKLSPTNMVSSGEVEDYQIRLTGAVIGDRVWKDLNGNGIQDAGEPALTNVTMKLYNSVSNVVTTTVSDVDGHYSFDGLQPGTYFVQALSPTNTIPTPAIAGNDTDVDSNGNAAGWSGAVTVAAGQTRNDIDFGFYEPARLYGFAYQDKDNVLMRTDTSGSASGMVVEIWLDNVRFASTHTDANGYYTFDNLVAGTYEVRFTSNTAALTKTPAEGTTAASSPERNRAVAAGSSYATVTYTIAAGQGIDENNMGEPINAGFRGSGPMSSAIDLRAYQGADGVYVEFIAYDVEEAGTIRLYLLDANGNVVWSGAVDVVASPRQVCRFLVPGLVLGGTYSFKVRDEVGKIWSAQGVTVKPFAAEMVKMSLAGITLAFESLPERDYEIQWTARLGTAWRTVTNIPSQGERTSVIVTHPDPTSPSGFFRIRMK